MVFNSHHTVFCITQINNIYHNHLRVPKVDYMFDKLADVIIKRPKMIVAIWAIALLLSVGVILTQESTLQYDMTQMKGGGSESLDGMAIIEDGNLFYQDNTASMGTIVIVEYGTAAEETEFFNVLDSKVTNRYGADAFLTKIGIPASMAGNMAMYSMSYVNPDLKTTDQVPIVRDLINETRSEISGSHGYTYTTYVTGSDAISYDTEAGAMKDMERIDPFSILLILVLIGLFFRSFVAAAAPPLAVGAAYGIITCAIVFMGTVMDIFYITPIILLVSMLGAGCDYCIFILARYREERKSGKDKEGALRESVRWAGESIATSGLSVIIGFGVMSVCTFSMISTMGIVLALGIVVALFAALTLIPSIIRLTGDKIFTPSTIETYTEGSKAMNGWYGNWSRRGAKYFEGSARHAIKYAKPIVIAAILVTIPLAYVMMTEESSYDMIATMPPGEAKEGMDIVVDTLGGGTLMPTYIITEFNTPLATVDPASSTLTWNLTMPEIMALVEIEIGMMELDNVKAADSVGVYVLLRDTIMKAIFDGTVPLDPTAIGTAIQSALPPGMLTAEQVEVVSGLVYQRAAGIIGATGLTPSVANEPILTGAYDFGAYMSGMISSDGKYIKTTVIMEDEPMSNISMGTIDTIRTYMGEVQAASAGLIVANWVTGTTAVTYDISAMVNEEFMWIELGVVILIFLLLFFVMKSYLTPLRAILTILMSIAWTVGLTHILFGWILDTPVMWIIPIVLLVICLGLGMDYDILLTTRIRENVTKGMSNDEAISHAIQRSGAVITICGLIMSGTFFTLTLSSSPMLQEFGFALGFAIFIDALIVRTYIVPAVMHLLGDWNWKGPKFMHRKKQIAEEAGSESETGSEE